MLSTNTIRPEGHVLDALYAALDAAAPDRESWLSGKDAFNAAEAQTSQHFLDDSLVAALNAAAPDGHSWLDGREAFYAAHDNQTVQPVQHRSINLQQWKGMAVIVAAVGLLIGVIIMLAIQGIFFPGIENGPLEVVRNVTLWTIPIIGIFAGGVIGSSIESNHADDRETIVAE